VDAGTRIESRAQPKKPATMRALVDGEKRGSKILDGGRLLKQESSAGCSDTRSMVAGLKKTIDLYVRPIRNDGEGDLNEGRW